MKVFTVLAMDDFNKRLSIEPFSSLKVALDHAAWIVRHDYGLAPEVNPIPQYKWASTDMEYIVFECQDDKNVFVSVLEQDIREDLPNAINYAELFRLQPKLAPLPTPVDEPGDFSLPAGWTHDGKPICMDVLFNDPESVENHYDLTIVRQFALAIARVSKRPYFSFTTDIGVLTQSSALYELKNKTGYGWDIMDQEMEYLDTIRSQYIYNHDYYDD
jgi:hypothetical protein